MTDRIREHAITLLRANEELPDVTVMGILYALSKYHDREDSIGVLSEMQEDGTMMVAGRRPFLAVADDE